MSDRAQAFLDFLACLRIKRADGSVAALVFSPAQEQIIRIVDEAIERGERPAFLRHRVTLGDSTLFDLLALYHDVPAEGGASGASASPHA